MERLPGYAEISEVPRPNKRGQVALRISLFALAVPIIILYLVVLTGCLNHLLNSSNLYTVEISNTTSTTTPHFRVGYVGICAQNQASWTCAAVTSSYAGDISQRLLGAGLPAFDPTNLSMIQFGIHLQHHVLIPTLGLAFLLFLAGIVSLPFLHYVRNSEQCGGDVRFRWATLTFLWSSAGLTAVSAGAITMAVGAMSFTAANSSGLQVRSGFALQLIQWHILLLSILFSFGVMCLRGKRESKGSSSIPLFDGYA